MGRSRFATTLHRAAAKHIDFSAIPFARVVALSKLPLLTEDATIDPSEVDDHVARAAAGGMIDRNAGALNCEGAFLLVGGGKIESIR